MRIGLNAGHGKDGSKSCGAIGLVKESSENRNVVKYLREYLVKEGHQVFDCTVDYPKSASDCINQIVNKANSYPLDLFISIHFNAGANDSKGNEKSCGTEVLVYNQQGEKYVYAKRVVEQISKLGFTNRGVKTRTNLGVLKSTKAPSILIECCFVDDKDDILIYDPQKMALAITKGIINKDIKDNISTQLNSNLMKIKVDGVLTEFNSKVIEGRTYVMLRDFEKMGYKIGYTNGVPSIDKP